MPRVSAAYVATARFVAFPLLVLALFAAVGLGALLGRVRPRWARLAIVGAVVVLVGAESMMGIFFAEAPSDAASRAVNRALVPRDPAPVLELPGRFARRRVAVGLHRDTPSVPLDDR